MVRRTPPKPDSDPDEWSTNQASNYARAYCQSEEVDILWSNHLWVKHPERNITRGNIVEVLAQGNVFRKEPPNAKYVDWTWTTRKQVGERTLEVVFAVSKTILTGVPSLPYRLIFVTAYDSNA